MPGPIPIPFPIPFRRPRAGARPVRVATLAALAVLADGTASGQGETFVLHGRAGPVAP